MIFWKLIYVKNPFTHFQRSSQGSPQFDCSMAFYLTMSLPPQNQPSPLTSQMYSSNLSKGRFSNMQYHIWIVNAREYKLRLQENGHSRLSAERGSICEHYENGLLKVSESSRKGQVCPVLPVTHAIYTICIKSKNLFPNAVQRLTK